MRKLLVGLATLACVLLSPIGLAYAKETIVSDGPTTVNLSGGLNAGTHTDLATMETGPGTWTVIATVRLAVNDPSGGKPAADQKNSQGCGVYADGAQVGGAGGSSSLWTPFNGGKDVTFTEWWDGSQFQPAMIVTGPTTLVLNCFIDASHSGVTEADRESMEATNIELVAIPWPDVTPAAPTITHPDCDEPGEVTITEQEGVTYDPAESVTVEHGDKVTVTATISEGFDLAKGAETEWTFTAVRNPCDGEQGEKGDKGDSGVTPAVTTTLVDCETGEAVEFDGELVPGDIITVNGEQAEVVEECPAATPEEVPTVISAGAETLPDTGVNPELLGAFGVGLALLGAGGVLGARKYNASRK